MSEIEANEPTTKLNIGAMTEPKIRSKKKVT